MSASVLFDSPGPKTRARHRIYSVVVVIVLVALIALACVVAISALGGGISTAFDNIKTKLGGSV